ncbi:hypothetical protein K402DRAFT_219860 [Aulographum hederae CBS 113979]|uniref:Uncharacterized protein n=1 Tax=Aulographum hederae CBS 113979 TaxID=1176131 RepID=A0A6G1GLT0_9PEZI|nr:hypothetical protein K402DRAFT_219860 [Aulographum hederae CBS 113979]
MLVPALHISSFQARCRLEWIDEVRSVSETCRVPGVCITEVCGAGLAFVLSCFLQTLWRLGIFLIAGLYCALLHLFWKAVFRWSEQIGSSGRALVSDWEPRAETMQSISAIPLRDYFVFLGTLCCEPGRGARMEPMGIGSWFGSS